MQHSSLFNALQIKRSENKNLALWDSAQPIPLDELKAKFAALTRNQTGGKTDQATAANDDLMLEELYKIFETLEDLDDSAVVFFDGKVYS